jgi:hypothetical protein
MFAVAHHRELLAQLANEDIDLAFRFVHSAVR